MDLTNKNPSPFRLKADRISLYRFKLVDAMALPPSNQGYLFVFFISGGDLFADDGAHIVFGDVLVSCETYIL